MNFIGVDLHKNTLSLCVIVCDGDRRRVTDRRRFACSQAEQLRDYFQAARPFRVTVEATASYEWFVQLVEPLADRVVLAHPKKLRVIAESTRKSDRLDAQVLAEFLALDMIPTAYRPTPRQREHRALVRHRAYVQQRLTAVRNKIRRVLSHYNLDRKDLFTVEGLAWLATVAVSASDRFILEQLRADLDHHRAALATADRRLKAFGQEAPPAEAQARKVLASIPQVGPVTVDVVVSELGDIGRFRSQKQVAAYAGLAPGQRESAGRTKALGITKEGSRLLRWVLVEAAWRQVAHSRRWGEIYAGLKKRCGAKRAIVAVARRLLGVMASLLRSGQDYRLGAG